MAQAETLKDLIKDWNGGIETCAEKVKQWNAELKAMHDDGKVSAETVMAMLEPLPKPIPEPTLQWCRDWKLRWGWAMLTRSADEGQFLPFDHPDMACARACFHRMFTTENVHETLVLNYDQVWRNCWATSRFRVCYKDRSRLGKRGCPHGPGPREDKKISQPKGARRAVTAT